jgi:choline dehydrogenase
VIVVGAGSTGATAATRLTEDTGCRVLLLEAGPDSPAEATNPPNFLSGGSLAGAGTSAGPPVPELDWNYVSEPIGDEGWRMPLMRGRLVGGSSMTNGCVAVRARPSDLDRWAEAEPTAGRGPTCSRTSRRWSARPRS